MSDHEGNDDSPERGGHGAGSLAERRQALSTVFTTFTARWPRFFSLDRAPDLMPVWLAATSQVDVPVLTVAAVSFAATTTNKYAPDPAVFAAFAGAMQRRHDGSATPSAAATATRSYDPYVTGRPFWFDSIGAEKGPRRISATRGVAYALPNGCLGISSSEVDAMYDGTLQWGYLSEADLDALPLTCILPSRQQRS